MRKRQKRLPADVTWRNGPSFSFGANPPERYKTVMDFEIALVPTGADALGILMEWRSATLGLLTSFVFHGHLEQADVKFFDAGGELVRLTDGWRPVGTVESPFIELDLGYVLAAWADDRFVYVQHGNGDLAEDTIRTWYRVPVSTFDAAWEDMLQRRVGSGDVR